MIGARLLNRIPVARRSIFAFCRPENNYTPARRVHDKPLPVLTLYTKEVCSLCDDAKATLEPFKHRYMFEEVDIEEDGNEEWFEKYRYDIPVFHLNGLFLMKHKVNMKVIDRKLKELEEA